MYIFMSVKLINIAQEGDKKRGGGREREPSKIDVMNNLFYLLIYMQAHPASLLSHPPRFVCFQFNL